MGRSGSRLPAVRARGRLPAPRRARALRRRGAPAASWRRRGRRPPARRAGPGSAEKRGTARSCGSPREEEPSRGEKPELLRRALRDRIAVRVDDQVGGDGRLVWIAHAGEVGDLAPHRLAVEALHVPLYEGVERGVCVDLQERNPFLVGEPSHLGPGFGVGRDGGGHDPHAVAGEEAGDEPDAADVRIAILAGEPETLRQMRAHLVTVEDLHLPLDGKRLADLLRERALARSGESGKPEDEAGLARLPVDPAHSSHVRAEDLGYLGPGELAGQVPARPEDLAHAAAGQVEPVGRSVRAGARRGERVAGAAEEGGIEPQRRDPELPWLEGIEDELRLE